MTDETDREELCLIFRLGLERCQQNLAHLHALVHTSGAAKGECAISAALAALIANLERELLNGREWLDLLAA